MSDAVIVAAVRTPSGRFQGVLGNEPAVELGAAVIRGLLTRTGLAADQVDEVIMGQVLTAGAGQNPARQSALRAGLPYTVPAMTLNKLGGSGLKAVQLAAQAIRCGDADVVIAGGQESVSNAPFVLQGARNGLRMGHESLRDSLLHDGLWDAFNDCPMGMTAENLAEQYGLCREQQDAYTLVSHQRAEQAHRHGRFQAEIVPVTVRDRRGNARVIEHDEHPLEAVTPEGLASLRPSFAPDGSVTAGNAAPLSDGAAAVMLMSEDKALQLGLPILGRIAAFASAGVDPTVMGTGPVFATDLCLQKAGWTLGQLELIEASEAFAVQALAVQRELGWDLARVNVNGGALALGHPLGASGCRLLVSLLHEMHRRNLSRGLATLCIGGGQGVAMAIQRALEHHP